MKRPTKVLTISAAMLLAAAGLYFLPRYPYVSRQTHICSRCRALRHVEREWFTVSQSIELPEYAGWYAGKHPDHQHKWSFLVERKSMLGLRSAEYAHPAVARIPEEVQRRFEASASSRERERFYSLIESANEDDQDQAVQVAFDAYVRQAATSRSAPGT